ncbi:MULTISPECIES: hypothetical protein [unclassified Novosphingobium]|uniref:hypothetical protein n=1 Tax=Novosphingobium TaxID=165696 RepID=UPI0014472718|nr:MULTISPECIES: hypothetical protein [unclassified Novosphingobium]NKJ41902.1 hypothetical protein [Novosphingobium sp. SG720]NMN04291.1 hypothetical protein [Novosphingobium sp. SG919]NMN85718.1 hypothetical protein [Novosphingobium sp. SG916]
MNRTLVGALGALMLVAAGVFWWQGHAAVQRSQAVAAVPTGSPPSGAAEDESLPTADGDGLQGAALPHASEATREQRRFDRFDKDRDGRITRNEMLAPRAKDFRKLDTDGNNLLSFEEWAVSTDNKFKAADANGDSALTRTEFATTKQQAKKPACKCH